MLQQSSLSPCGGLLWVGMKDTLLSALPAPRGKGQWMAEALFSEPFLHSLSGKFTRDQTSHLSRPGGVLCGELGTRREPSHPDWRAILCPGHLAWNAIGLQCLWWPRHRG